MINKGIKQLVAEANELIETVDAEEAIRRAAAPSTLLVDIRDYRELRRDGTVAGAYHAPRGMLEFWLDPESPYHRPALSGPDHLVLYCAGGLRSALAARALVEMGHESVAHVKDGFTALKNAGARIVDPETNMKAMKQSVVGAR